MAATIALKEQTKNRMNFETGYLFCHVETRAAPYGVLLFLLCTDFMGQQKGGFEQPVPHALRPAGHKRPSGAFLGRGSATPFGHTQKPHCNVFLQ